LEEIHVNQIHDRAYKVRIIACTWKTRRLPYTRKNCMA